MYFILKSLYSELYYCGKNNSGDDKWTNLSSYSKFYCSEKQALQDSLRILVEHQIIKISNREKYNDRQK